MATKSRKADIPRYELGDFRHLHRAPGESSDFGCNQLERSKFIDGFELYSSHGLIGSVGPLRSAFYRISITVSGELDMQIGLEHYRHHPRTLSFTFPDQIFLKNNISADASGYYMLFKEHFLDELLPVAAGPALVGRFQKLVGTHFLTTRTVADYASLLAVSPNHLNKVVKEVTGKTASDSISEMLVQEAKSLLRYTDSSIAEIAYKLDFSDPASFNRFFKGGTGETPLAWRNRHA